MIDQEINAFLKYSYVYWRGPYHVANKEPVSSPTKTADLPTMSFEDPSPVEEKSIQHQKRLPTKVLKSSIVSYMVYLLRCICFLSITECAVFV